MGRRDARPVQPEGVRMKPCQECKTSKALGIVNPYWFHELKRHLWVCRDCIDSVWLRYREKNK